MPVSQLEQFGINPNSVGDFKFGDIITRRGQTTRLLQDVPIYDLARDLVPRAICQNAAGSVPDRSRPPEFPQILAMDRSTPAPDQLFSVDAHTAMTFCMSDIYEENPC